MLLTMLPLGFSSPATGSSIGSSATSAAAATDIPLVTFDGVTTTTFEFQELNDPVMGGKSTGTWSQAGTFGVFEGDVVDVPSLKAPGFIKAAADGHFVDISAAASGALVLRVRSSTPGYGGFRVSFASGTVSPSYACAGGGSIPLSRGCFKTNFSVPSGNSFTDVVIPFSKFSDKWSPATGDQTTTCAQSADVCPTAFKLSAIKRVELWAEGALGRAQLDIASITARYDARDRTASAAALELGIEEQGLAVRARDCPTVSVQSGFNLTEFVEGGKWFIQQQMSVLYLPASQDYCVTAAYSFTDASKTTVHVHNYANGDRVNGKVYDSDKNVGILGGICADLKDPAHPAKLSVGPCNLPSWLPGARGPYWVLAAGPSPENYEWALISGGQPTHRAAGGCRTGTGVNDSGLWIFTRKAERDDAVVAKLRGIAQDMGFDLSVLNDVQQAGCEYKPA